MQLHTYLMLLLDERVKQAMQPAVNAHTSGTQIGQLQLAPKRVVIVAKPVDILAILELVSVGHCNQYLHTSK